MAETTVNEQTSHFELPPNIERYLATLSIIYAQTGKHQLQEIIVNARLRIQEGWSYDNWNGGTSGHAIFLSIPTELFSKTLKNKDDIQNQIKDDLNEVAYVQNETIDQVFIELEEAKDGEWRKESGALIAATRVVPSDVAERIWGNDGFRVFLSHRSNVKGQTAYLKTQLQLFGVSCFVAHEDIHPTKVWQDEIENALRSMDCLVALMTTDFHESEWTDQEVGFAFGLGVPIIPVRLGTNPYGFIEKFQALPSTWENAAENIAKILINNNRMFSAYVQALRRCPNWVSGNIIAEVLPSIEKLTEDQIDELIAAYNQHSELHNSFGFSGLKPNLYGEGLAFHLNRLSNRIFQRTSTRLIKEIFT